MSVPGLQQSGHQSQTHNGPATSKQIETARQAKTQHEQQSKEEEKQDKKKRGGREEQTPRNKMKTTDKANVSVHSGNALDCFCLVQL